MTTTVFFAALLMSPLFEIEFCLATLIYLKYIQLFQKLKLDTKNLQEQSILLLTITRYIVLVVAEKIIHQTRHMFITNKQTSIGYVNNHDKNRYL